MQATLDQTLGQLVDQDHRAAAILEAQGLDFCCHGNDRLGAACSARRLDPQAVIATLAALPPPSAADASATTATFATLPLAELATRIEDAHHPYVKRMLPQLTAHVNKIAQVHGAHHPELLEVADLWAAVAAELDGHLMKEEQVLFPYLRALTVAAATGAPAPSACFTTVAGPIQMMLLEHEHAGDGMDRIRTLTHDYAPPADACTTYRVTLQELAEFTADLHLHVFKENHHLFPRALALEQELRG